MSLDYRSISEMSNQALFSMISNKKQTIESMQKKGQDSKRLEVDYCYLIREHERRFAHKKPRNQQPN